MNEYERAMRMPHVCTLNCQIAPTDHLPAVGASGDCGKISGKEDRDPAQHIKKRIADWLKTQDGLYGDYSGEVDSDQVEELLLHFYEFLQECEAERQRS